MGNESRTSAPRASRRIWILALALVGSCSTPDSSPPAGPVEPTAGQDPPSRPNIVFILADDMGWADAGYNGTEFYETPNIDQLTLDGMTFSRAYSGGPNCAPTRATLLTGMYPPRHHVYTPGARSRGPQRYMRLAVPVMSGKANTIPSRAELAAEAVSIAEVLGAAGYRTARLGKWHVGKDNQGFDISSLGGESGPGRRQFHDPDSSAKLTRAGIRFMQADPLRPFFLFLSLWDPHLPLAADAQVVARYEQKLEEQPGPWDPTYAAMIEAVDRTVGDVRAAVRDLGIERETLFIFASDNGGESWLTPSGPLRSGKGSLFEGGIRVPTCMVWPGHIQAASLCGDPVTSVDYLPTFAELGGAHLPDTQPVDGRSMVPLMHGAEQEERAIFWFFPLYLYGIENNVTFPIFGTQIPYWRGVPSATIMRGPWKLTRYFEDESVQLYNVDRDIGESRELAAVEPERAAELLVELNAWLEATAAPIPHDLNPTFLAPVAGEEIEAGSPRSSGKDIHSSSAER